MEGVGEGLRRVATALGLAAVLALATLRSLFSAGPQP
jgi:hypothetical protein